MKPSNLKTQSVQIVTRTRNVSSFGNANTFYVPTASVDREYVSSARVKNKVGIH
jgi:hypothetical protein